MCSNREHTNRDIDGDIRPCQLRHVHSLAVWRCSAIATAPRGAIGLQGCWTRNAVLYCHGRGFLLLDRVKVHEATLRQVKVR